MKNVINIAIIAIATVVMTAGCQKGRLVNPFSPVPDDKVQVDSTTTIVAGEAKAEVVTNTVISSVTNVVTKTNYVIVPRLGK